MTEQLPAKIGKYDITGVAGRGAMGVVYIGHDPFVDRKVAIKISTQEGDLDDGGMSPTARRMFFNEAKAAGSLDHPNILRVYDAGEADGQPYIVMEFVDEADTLKSFCKPETLLPLATAVDYMRQAALALDYAHKHHVTHRDVKPANIMLTRKGVVKLVDFGIAQRTRPDQTQLMGWFGSPLYMSPEQAADGPITFQSDLFSLGVVMYEMVAGETPFSAKGISGLINNVLNKDPRPLTELRPEVPQSLWQVIRRCLEKKPNRRWESGAAVAEALEAVLADLDNPLLDLDDAQKLELARGLGFFEGFSDAEINEVVAASRWRAVAADTTIVEEAAANDGVYIIVSGDVSVTRSGREIAVLGEGDCFGEMAYLTDTKRSASVVARGPVSFMVIEEPLRNWASLPLQMRLARVFQALLIKRLAATSRRLAGLI